MAEQHLICDLVLSYHSHCSIQTGSKLQLCFAQRAAANRSDNVVHPSKCSTGPRTHIGAWWQCVRNHDTTRDGVETGCGPHRASEVFSRGGKDSGRARAGCSIRARCGQQEHQHGSMVGTDNEYCRCACVLPECVLQLTEEEKYIL